MSRVSMIHHLNVQISNRERTQAWYQNVLGVEFIDRGSVSNQRQLQLCLGTGEIHFTERPSPRRSPPTTSPWRFPIGRERWPTSIR
jgi:catechol 2,3-dioxygenase-like lactoylglutathione lyase family enzyme